MQELYFLPNLQFRISDLKLGKPLCWMKLVFIPQFIEVFHIRMTQLDEILGLMTM